MKKITISNEELKMLSDAKSTNFPKYVPQIINLANQNAQGTRPKVVGQLSDLLPQFLQESSDTSIEAWEKWYSQKFPGAIDEATGKISIQLENLKEAIDKIDDSIIKEWVKDLVITKTYTGLNIQELILKKIANEGKRNYRLATTVEESKGIDGYVADKAYSIKPTSYESKNMLNESIEVTMIKYAKEKVGLKITIEE